MARVRSNPKYRRRTFLREWREHRGMKLEQVAEEIGITATSLSQTERGLIGYTQPMLEALAYIYGCDPADLIMRNPQDEEAPWSIWEKLKPEQRKQAIRLLKALYEDQAA